MVKQVDFVRKSQSSRLWVSSKNNEKSTVEPDIEKAWYLKNAREATISAKSIGSAVCLACTRGSGGGEVVGSSNAKEMHDPSCCSSFA